MGFTDPSDRPRKWIAILGMFLILCPQGIMWYWGNMYVYINSYIVRNIINNTTITTTTIITSTTTTTAPNAQSTWFIACFELTTSLGLFLSGFLSHTIGDRITMVIGMVTFLLALVCSYFMIDVNGLAMEIIVGAVTGGGLHITNGVIMKYTMKLAGDDFGYIHSIIQNGLSVGPIVINQLITLYINPDNLSPDYTIGPSVYFSQDDLLDRVPRVFWVIAICVILCDVIGMVMVELTYVKITSRSLSITHEKTVSYGATKPEVKSDITIISETNGIVPGSSDLSEVRGQSSELNKSIDLTIGQAIRTPMMYICMLFVIFGSITYALNTVFYKAYGQIYINDDHFITNVSMGLLTCATIAKLGWGWILDRLSLKTVYIIFFSWSGISCLGFYFSPMLNKWLYAIMTAMFTMSGCPIYIISTVTCRNIFGKKYVSICGLVYLPPAIIVMFTPVIFEELLTAFGWFSVYATCCTLSVTGLVICLFVKFQPTVQ